MTPPSPILLRASRKITGVYPFYEHVYMAFDNDDFAHIDEEGGRQPTSPRFLACLTILQYIFKVSDRPAEKATGMWRHWRIAPGVHTKQYTTGFHPTVLTKFRQRVKEHGRQRELFEAILDILKEHGILKHRRTVRVDSTHLLADVSRRSRLDGIAEAIRVVVCELAESYPQLRDHISFRTLFDEYRHPGWLGISSEDPSFSHRCPFRITSIPESFVDAPFGRDPEPPQRITITHELQRPLHVSAHRRNRKFMRRTRGFLQTAINKRSDKYRNGHSSRRRGATRHQLLAIERRYILAVLQGANTR